MRALLLVAVPLLLAGCILGDPISSSGFLVSSPRSNVSLRELEREVIRITDDVAAQYDLKIIHDRIQERNGRTYDFFREGKNPTLFLTVNRDGAYIKVLLIEQYIARPTDRHRQLRDELRSRFQKAGLVVTS